MNQTSEEESEEQRTPQGYMHFPEGAFPMNNNMVYPNNNPNPAMYLDQASAAAMAMGLQMPPQYPHNPEALGYPPYIQHPAMHLPSIHHPAHQAYYPYGIKRTESLRKGKWTVSPSSPIIHYIPSFTNLTLLSFYFYSLKKSVILTRSSKLSMLVRTRLYNLTVFIALALFIALLNLTFTLPYLKTRALRYDRPP